MLDSLLTLLPRWTTPFELEFHTQFVLRNYREYLDIITATGLRDRKVLATLKERTAYSMSILLWHRPSVWMRIYFFHVQLAKLRTILPLEVVPKLLKPPY